MANHDFFELLKKFKQSVDNYIFDFLPEKHDIPEIDLLFTMMRDYPSRPGKGLRPGLLMLFNRAFGGDDDMAINSAAALEIFQNWIVIHDDIEDQSDLRRGLPALHITHGVPLALNAGDALAGKMWELIYKNYSILGEKRAGEIFNEFLIMYARTTEGQHVELSWAADKNWNLTDSDYLNMCERKTAWYTCISPSYMGSLIAGADDTLKESFVKFGRELGVAFQIQDDVLNLIGEPEKYGKEIGGDILEGKRTLVLIDLLSKCAPEEKTFVTDNIDLARESKDPRIIHDVITLMKKYGSIKYSVDRSFEIARSAKQTYLDKIKPEINPEYDKPITDLIDFMVNREF